MDVSLCDTCTITSRFLHCMVNYIALPDRIRNPGRSSASKLRDQEHQWEVCDFIGCWWFQGTGMEQDGIWWCNHSHFVAWLPIFGSIAQFQTGKGAMWRPIFVGTCVQRSLWPSSTVPLGFLLTLEPLGGLQSISRPSWNEDPCNSKCTRHKASGQWTQCSDFDVKPSILEGI